MSRRSSALVRAWLSAVAIWLGLCVAAALADDHVHPTETITGEDALFYSNWMRPDNIKQSCCNKQDCKRTAALYDQQTGKWSARSRHGNWIAIPSEKIERFRDVPVGAHLCENSSGVLCFGVGAGG